MRLYDTHCHLQASVFDQDRDRDGGVLDRAAAGGVAAVLCCATAPDDWGAVLGLTRQTRLRVVPAFGVHPWYIPPEPLESWLPRLETLLAAHPEAWVGEIGIDRTAGPPLETQEAVLGPQLDLACRLGRAASLHCRKTWDRLGLLLRRRRDRSVPVVLHSFSGSLEAARSLMDENAYFSFSGSLTNPRNARLPRVLAALPPDRVLIETDSPDIVPRPAWERNPGAPNEPANLVWVLKAAAQAWGLDEDRAAEVLEQNSRRLLGL